MGLIGAHILQPDYLPVTQCHITEVNFKHWCQSLKITQSTSSLTDPPRASVWYQLWTTRINDQKQITIRRVTKWRNFLMSYILLWVAIPTSSPAGTFRVSVLVGFVCPCIIMLCLWRVLLRLACSPLPVVSRCSTQKRHVITWSTEQ